MITVTDFIGHTDNSGKPMGHPVKVTNETVELIRSVVKTGAAAPVTHMKEINAEGCSVFELKNHICVFSGSKIKNLIEKWKNLHQVFHSPTGTVWFINVDFSLFLYLYLFKSNKHDVWVTLCYNPLKNLSGWRKTIIEKVLGSTALVIVTNKNFLKSVPGNKVFVPDYYYKKDFYGGFSSKEKKEQIVCLGTMGRTKKLEEMAEVLSGREMPLKIIGNFAQELERFEEIKKLCKENVSIENRYVSNTEYYNIIAESRYVILPYDMELYDERTSGILLESVFLDSIPVAPKKLLEYNSINGIGYSSIDEIPELLNISDEEKEKIIIENNKLKNTVFSQEKIGKILQSFLKEQDKGI